MTHAVAIETTTRPANRSRSGEMKMLTAIEADLESARRRGSAEAAFLALEEVYVMHLHSKDRNVQARCGLLLLCAGGAAAA